MISDISFKTGDMVKVSQKFSEGKRERVISFEGIVTKFRGKNENAMVTVRQNLEGVAVDRILPLGMLNLVDIKVVNESKKVRGNLPRKMKLDGSKSKMFK